MNLFDISNCEIKLKELESKTIEPDFWSNSDLSKSVLEKIKRLKDKVQEYNKTKSKLNNLIEMIELLSLEKDDSLVEDIQKELKVVEKEIEELELKTFLSGKYDSNNAILTIHPGAGRNRVSRLG